MSVGAAWAGIRTSLAVENDPHAALTYKLNHLQTEVLSKRIQEIVDFEALRPLGPMILYGGPPCQGFSTSNQKTRNSANENNWLFSEFTRAVKQAQPEWVVFENVKGIVETEGGRFLDEILSQFNGLGYKFDFGVLDASQFGVPQKRSRLFIVATNTGSSVSLPEAGLEKRVTVSDAIGDLPELANGAAVDVLPYGVGTPSAYAKLMRGKAKFISNNLVSRNSVEVLERYRHVPQGGNWEDIPNALMSNYKDRSRCHTGIYRRLRADDASVVIGNFRKNMLIHPTQDRGLSVREAARLQSFPDDFRFSGSIGFQQQQVGNAVPPLLAKAVFNHIKSISREGVENEQGFAIAV